MGANRVPSNGTTPKPKKGTRRRASLLFAVPRKVDLEIGLHLHPLLPCHELAGLHMDIVIYIVIYIYIYIYIYI